MRNPVVTMCLKDDLDMHLYGKPLRDVLDTYAGYAYGALELGKPEEAKDYLHRLILCLRGNSKSHENSNQN